MEENKEKEVVNSEDVLPSEAVHAFVLWLSCRYISTTFSVFEPRIPGGVLAYEFIRSQGWKDSRGRSPDRFKPFPEEDTHEKFKGIIESNKLNHGSGTESGVLASHLISCLENYERTQMQASKKG
jgi:hypothetical protein